MTDDEYLTVAEVAERLKLNQQTIRNWIDGGTLPAYRVGRRVRVSLADFNAKVAAGATGSPGLPVIDGPTADDFWGGVPVAEADLPQNLSGA